MVEVAGRAPKSMSVIAGSCGYIAPDKTFRMFQKFSFGPSM
jgi:hypothetical protein